MRTLIETSIGNKVKPYFAVRENGLRYTVSFSLDFENKSPIQAIRCSFIFLKYWIHFGITFNFNYNKGK